MRLDVFLVKQGYFETRQKAKDAIKRGFILVNGKVAEKPSIQICGSESISVLYSGKPKGYWKLKKIDEELNILNKDDVVLDMGSSAGGFLSYSSEVCKKVIGIEYSMEFENELKSIENSCSNVRVIFGDIFKLDIQNLPMFDVILDDLTTEPENSARALIRFLSKLKVNGKVLFVVKGLRKFDWNDITSLFEDLRVLKPVGYMTLDKQEMYIKLIKQKFKT